MLDANTFSNQEIINISSENLLSFKINAETQKGSESFTEFKGFAYPLIIFLTPDKKEIDRFYGYLDVPQFLAKINNVINNKETFQSYLSDYSSGNKSAGTLNNLAKKYADRGNDSLALKLYNELLTKSNLSLNNFHSAKFFIAQLSLKNGINNDMLEYLNNFPDNPYLEEAIYALSNYYQLHEQIDNELLLYVKYLNQFLANHNFSVICHGYGPGRAGNLTVDL